MMTRKRSDDVLYGVVYFFLAVVFCLGIMCFGYFMGSVFRSIR